MNAGDFINSDTHRVSGSCDPCCDESRLAPRTNRVKQSLLSSKNPSPLHGTSPYQLTVFYLRIAQSCEEELPIKWREGHRMGDEKAFAAIGGIPNFNPPNFAPEIMIKNLIFCTLVRANPCVQISKQAQYSDNKISRKLHFLQHFLGKSGYVPLLGFLAMQLLESPPEKNRSKG